MNNENIYGGVMLATLSIGQWTARKSDRKAAKEVSDANGMDSKAKGTYYKSLVSSDILNSINTLVGVIRDYHYTMTLPWKDSGPRILSTVAYMDYVNKMQAYSGEFEELVDMFVSEYPFEREEARRILGTLFNERDYPSTADVRASFRFKLDIDPLPWGSDFRCNIGNAEAEARIREEIESRTSASLRNAQNDAVSRVVAVVEAYINRLADENAVFRDSLVTNARELCDILPALNIMKDPNLDAIRTSLVDKLCTYDPDTLRRDKVLRREAYDAALKAKSDLSSFFGV